MLGFGPDLIWISVIEWIARRQAGLLARLEAEHGNAQEGRVKQSRAKRSRAAHVRISNDRVKHSCWPLMMKIRV